MNTGFRGPSIPFRSIHRLIQSVLPQLNFSFHRHQPIRADFSGGQITSDAGLLPLRAFDQRHYLTREWAADLIDPRQNDRLRHDSLALLRQRLYQIVAGYGDANDADRLRHDPTLQIVADQKLGDALGSQPTLSRWENTPSARDLVHTNQPDHAASAVTTDQQGNNKTDLKLTASIRRSIVADGSLSTYAHNVKIVVENGVATVKGPVRTEEEKAAIAAKAAAVVGQDHVVHQMEIAPQ